jgi:hypothetical protein
MARPSPDGPKSDERYRPASVLRYRQRQAHACAGEGALALLMGHRVYVMEASVHSRRFVLVHYTAPGHQGGPRRGEQYFYTGNLSIKPRPAIDELQPENSSNREISIRHGAVAEVVTA